MHKGLVVGLAVVFFLSFGLATAVFSEAEAFEYMVFGQYSEDGTEYSKVENNYTYVQFDSVQPAYVWGNIKVTYDNTDKVECISIEEPYDYYGFWNAWTPAASDLKYGGGGELYHYSDGGGEWAQTYANNGFGWATPGSIDRQSGSIYFYTMTFANYESFTAPLRLGFRLKDGVISPVTVTFNIYSNAGEWYDWFDEDLVSSGQYQVVIKPEFEMEIISAVVDITPDTLNLKSKGQYVTAHIEIPDYDLSLIDLSSVYLDGDIPAGSKASIEDYDLDGVPDLTVKFSRASLADIPAGESTLKITGTIDGVPFEGSDTIRVIK